MKYKNKMKKKYLRLKKEYSQLKRGLNRAKAAEDEMIKQAEKNDAARPTIALESFKAEPVGDE
ncbi:hypothetical protein [Desulfocastanea catecholica]